MIVSGSA